MADPKSNELIARLRRAAAAVAPNRTKAVTKVASGGPGSLLKSAKEAAAKIDLVIR